MSKGLRNFLAEFNLGLCSLYRYLFLLRIVTTAFDLLSSTATCACGLVFVVESVNVAPEK